MRAAYALALAGLALSATQASAASPYFSARFKVTRHPYSFLHGPSWAANGDVLSFELDRAGLLQIYRSRLNGSRQRCLTCRTVQGPNGLPQDRPPGDWILFESYGQQAQHLGAPGLGGYGGDLYAMREDGSHPHRLTTRSDPPGGVPYDNFHAYWSPDGRQVVRTHIEAYPLAQGGQRWEMLLGDFTVSHGVPSLQNVRVIGRPYGVYETQPWAPDGSGFLFSAAGGYRSPFQATPPGWGHMQLYYMRLARAGSPPRWTTYTGEFEGLGAAARKPPRRIPAPGLYGRPAEMKRVGAQAQPVRDPGPTDNPPIAVRPPPDPAAARPHAPRTSDTSTAPAVVLAYLDLWQSQVVELGRQAMESFTSPPLAAAAAAAARSLWR